MYSDQTSKWITEIINLESILNLPKGTEHFVSDLHGEFEAFDHILRNGSGSIRGKVQTLFSKSMSDEKIDELCFLIYYPEEKIQLLKTKAPLTVQWYTQAIESLITIARFTSSKYTRSKVRKALPKDHAYILEELIYQYDETTDKKDYYEQIIKKMIELNQAEPVIIDLAYLIQQFVVDHLHIIGDIYDRGPHPHKIMDKLMTYHSLDIQLGNHDIIWLGAISGSKACLANVLRISARYGNLDLLEYAYDINLNKLRDFSRKVYGDNEHFLPKKNPYRTLTSQETSDAMKIQQAMAIIQEKIEGQIIQRRPEFNMEHRLYLNQVHHGFVTVDQKNYNLVHTCFQTVKKEDPFQLTSEEEVILDDLLKQFQHSKRLLNHMRLLLDKGSLYLIYNQNLLIHGCVPLDKNGQFQSATFEKKELAGKALIDYFDQCIRFAFLNPAETQDYATDVVWYLWCGEYSSLFGKRAMRTFERYFIAEKETHVEEKNAYYSLRDNQQICEKILKEFTITTSKSHIINGHTPIQRLKGESPIKAEGKMLVIDGGFSKSYQKTTGIGGYTLLYNSYGMQLAAHKPFQSKQVALQKNNDILSTREIVDHQAKRLKVKDTTIGQQLANEANILSTFLKSYT